MTFAQTWSEAYLGATTRQDDIDAIVQNTRIGVRERAAVEHSAYADETGHDDVWRHAKAASRTNYGLAAAKPTTEATGRVDGARYLETDTGLIKYWNSTTEAWVTEGSIEHSDQTTTYTTGTVSVTNGSAVVTGTGTAFTDNVTTSDVFKGPDGEYYGIASVDSSVQVTLDRNYDGTTASGQSYTIYLDGHPQYFPKSGGTVNGTLTMAAALAMGANKITGLAAATANGDAVRYEQLLAGVTNFKTGTYTGDGGATQAITGTGIDLTSGTWFILIWQATVGMSYWSFAMTSNSDSAGKSLIVSPHGGDSSYTYSVNVIRSGDADGFTVGNHTPQNGRQLNANGVLHVYVIIKGS